MKSPVVPGPSMPHHRVSGEREPVRLLRVIPSYSGPVSSRLLHVMPLSSLEPFAEQMIQP